MNEKRKIYADFNNADVQGRLRLSCAGTLEDLRDKELELVEGLELTLSDGELAADGVATRSDDEAIWVATLDWR